MKALVVGGNGFIGSHILDELLRVGDSVVVCDPSPERFRSPLPGVEYHLMDMSDMSTCERAIEGVDVVIHLASTTVPSTSNCDPVRDVQDNLVRTLQLLELLLKKNIKRVVYLSSGGAVYGNPSAVPISEEHPLNPICSYGVVKVAVERYLYMYQHLHGLRSLVLRPSNPFGPRQGNYGLQGIIASALYKMKTGGTFTVWGDGSIVRDYLYVSDLARAVVMGVHSDATGTYNCGSGQGKSIAEMLQIVSAVSEKPLNVVWEEGRSFDVDRVVLDSTRAVKTFGWIPQISLEEGIQKHWKWLNELTTSLPQ